MKGLRDPNNENIRFNAGTASPPKKKRLLKKKMRGLQHGWEMVAYILVGFDVHTAGKKTMPKRQFREL